MFCVWISKFCSILFLTTGMMKESDKNSGKTYAVFAVRATKTSGDEEEVSETYRRYSDFHDLHMLIQEKVGKCAGHYLTDTERVFIKLNFDSSYQKLIHFII